jgi:hypothetical protein
MASGRICSEAQKPALMDRNYAHLLTSIILIQESPGFPLITDLSLLRDENVPGPHLSCTMPPAVPLYASP